MKSHFCIFTSPIFYQAFTKNYACVTKCSCLSSQKLNSKTLSKCVKCPLLLTCFELLFPSSYFWCRLTVECWKSLVEDCQKWQKISREMSKGEWRLNKRRLAKCQLGEIFPKCGWESKIYEETFLQKLSLRRALSKKVSQDWFSVHLKEEQYISALPLPLPIDSFNLTFFSNFQQLVQETKRAGV